MPTDPNNEGLFILRLWLHKLSDVLCSLVPVHFWHIAVHEDNRKLLLVVLPSLSHHFYGLKSIAHHVDPLSELAALEPRVASKGTLHDNFDGVDIVGLIIYEKELGWLLYLAHWEIVICYSVTHLVHDSCRNRSHNAWQVIEHVWRQLWVTKHQKVKVSLSVSLTVVVNYGFVWVLCLLLFVLFLGGFDVFFRIFFLRG